MEEAYLEREREREREKNLDKGNVSIFITYLKSKTRSVEFRSRHRFHSMNGLQGKLVFGRKDVLIRRVAALRHDDGEIE